MSELLDMLEQGRWISNDRIGRIEFVPHGLGENFYRRHYPFTLDLHHPDRPGYGRTVQEVCVQLRDQLGYAAFRKHATKRGVGGFECGRESLWHRTMMTMYFKHEEHAVLTRVLLL